MDAADRGAHRPGAHGVGARRHDRRWHPRLRLFLSYGATVVLVALNNRWKPGPTSLALISAIVPYATIPAEVWLHRRGLFAGSWRIEVSARDEDARWYDRPLAWFLRRPAVLFGGLAVVVAVVFAVLLVVGPPGGKA